MKKVSVTLDEDVLAHAKELVGARGLSAYLNEALTERLQQDGIARMLARLDAEHGPVPDHVTAEVETLMDTL